MGWPPRICQAGGLPGLEGRRNNRAKETEDQGPSAGLLKRETASSWPPAGLHLSREHRAPSLRGGPEPTTQSWLSVQQAFWEQPWKSPVCAVSAGLARPCPQTQSRPGGFGCDRGPVGTGEGLHGVLGWMREMKRGTRTPTGLDAFVLRNTHTPWSSYESLR